MPDNFSESKHLSSLDFDISQIPKNLEAVERYLRDSGQDVQRIIQENFNFNKAFQGAGGIGSGVSKEIEKIKREWNGAFKDIGKDSSLFNVSFSSADAQKQQLLQMVQAYGEVTNSVFKYNAKTRELSQATITYTDGAGRSVVETFKMQNQAVGSVVDGVQKYQKVWQQVGATATDNVQKRTTTLEREALTNKQLVSSLQQQSVAMAKIQSQAKQNASLSAYGKQAQELRQQIELLQKKLLSENKITAEQKQQILNLQTQTDALSTQTKMAAYDNPVTNNRSMLQEIASKTKWYLAGSAAFAGGYAAKETIKTLNDVEFKVMEITRVMNDASLNVAGFRDRLFGLAVEYGRSFDDVSEVALRFAQAGYSVQETLSMTKDSLLALNTAELDVQNSTESMIGIMQQWNFTANELSTIIDRINYTADNNAITSQDLVDGLLQASSVAKTANMSFDETIGVLTALKEASGRTGKEVGNAFKSILTYIQRPMSLKGFDEMGIEVFADKATGTLLPMMEILTNMSSKWNDMSISMQDTLVAAADDAGLFSEELAIATGTLDQYASANEAMTAASDKANDAETRAQANLAAGVYRRNYYIALMENMQKALSVTADLQNAEGYSLQENAKYMDTLQAKYTQFIAALKNLAVQAGESGLMDIAKGAIETATATTKLTTSVGGIIPVLFSVAGIIAMIKREKVAAATAEMASGIRSKIIDVSDTIKILQMEAKDAGGGLKGFSAAIKSTGTEAQIAAGAIGAAIFVISAITMAVSAYNQAQKEAKQKAMDAATAAVDEKNKISDLIKEYERLKKSDVQDETTRERILAIQTEIVGAVGNHADGLDLVNGKLAEQLGILTEIELVAARTAQETLRTAANIAENSYNSGISLWPSMSLGQSLQRTLAQDELGKAYAKNKNNETLKEMFTGSITGFLQGKDAQEQLDILRKYETVLNDLQESGFDVSSSLEIVSSRIADAKQLIEEYDASVKQLNTNAAKIAVQNSTVKVTDQGGFEAYRESLIQSAVASGDFRGTTEQITEAIDGVLQRLPQYAEYFKTLSGNAVDATDAIQAFVQGASELASSSSDVASGIQALESALQKSQQGLSLTADEVFNLVSIYPELAGQVKLTADGYYFEEEALNAARVALLNKLITEQMGIAVSQFSQGATQEQRNKLNELITALNQATTAEAALTAQTALYIFMANNAKGASGELANALSTIHSLIGTVNSIGTGSGSGGSSWAQKRIQALQKETKAIQDEYEKQIKAAREASKAIQDSYNAQIKAIKERYDAEIKGARAAKEARDRNRERADLQEEIEYWSKRTGAEAIDKLKDAQKKLSEKEADWSFDDYIQGLEDARDAEVKRLEAIRDAEVASYEAKIAELEALKEAEAEKSSKEIEALQKIAEATSGMYAAMQEDVKKTKEEEAQRATVLKEYGGQVFGTWTELYSYARKVAEEARLALQRQAEYTQRMASADSYSERTRIFNERQGYFPSSHTGSVVAKEGLVNVAPGEVIVRSDIQEGLLKMTQDYNRRLANVTNNTYNNSRPVINNFNAPFNNVEKQEFADSADIRIANDSTVRVITRELSKLTSLR